MTLLANRYELAEPLGSGGMARVVAAYDRTLGRRVAVKLVGEERAGDPVDHERLLREARSAGALHHPNTVAVFDAGQEHGRSFVVMELVEGETLADRLRAEGALAVEETVDIVAGVLAGLGAAHERGLVHRDVKPSNILLPRDGGVKLADFGIAKARTDAPTHLTATGEVVGTPRYLAPERASGEAATPESDLYALGVVAYECLAGRAPFEGDSPIAVAIAHQRDPVPPLAEAAPHVPTPLAAVVERALAKDPAARFARAEDMRRALEDPAAPTRPLGPAATAPLPGTGEAPGPARPDSELTTPATTATRRWWPVAAGLAVVLALGAALALGGGDGSPGDAAGDPAGEAAGSPEDADDPAGGVPDDPGGADPDADTGEDADPADAGEGEEAAPEGPTDPVDATDLDELMSSLALDPHRVGDEGEDLFDDLREVRNADDDDRGEKARELIDEIAEWVTDDELDPAVGRRAIELLEPAARPDDAERVEASALFAEVAADRPDWGEHGGDLVSELRDVLDADEPDDVADEAADLAEQVEEWRGDGEIDADLAARVRTALRPLSELGED